VETFELGARPAGTEFVYYLLTSDATGGKTDMAYDEDLAQRVREQLAAQRNVTEKAMFGGLAFLLDGNMAVGLSGDELMVRVGPGGSDAALAREHTRPFDTTGRPMGGWILVAPEGVKSERELGAWVAQGVAFARSLPAKG
jgi:hypothetical protein